MRSAGLKTVLRFVYNYPENETDFQNVQDASLTRVLAHIEQLAPALQDNADVISVLQGGFIGAWGEWHTSSNGLTDASARTQVRDALLAAMPTDKFIQLRYPGHVTAWYATAIAPSQAFSGSGQARIGLHNDCFLASATDVGTYSEDAATRALQRDYVAAVSQTAPFGGETKAACPKWNAAWATRNDGCARPYSARPMQIVLRHRTRGDVLRLSGSGVTADVRYAIRPANADSSATGAGWDATLGAFRLGIVLTVL